MSLQMLHLKCKLADLKVAPRRLVDMFTSMVPDVHQ